MYRKTLLITSAIILSACGKVDVAEETVIPRVKLYTVGQADNDRSRRFSGSVVASEQSPLSFLVGGTVQEIHVSRGAVVRSGQLLARLDEAPLRTSLDAARAQLTTARAKLDESKATYERYVDLGASGAISQADLETATADYTTARSGLQAAQSDIERFERDLANASLTAPFDGTVAERSIEPFQQVMPGQSAFVLLTTEALEVDVLIPESMISEVDYGDVVDISFPAIEGVTTRGSVQTIGSRAESGNSFPVTVRLQSAGTAIRPGMSAGVTFRFSNEQDSRTVYLIPISAIAIEAGVNTGLRENPESRTAPVFLFDESSGTLEFRQVLIGDIRGNYLEVFDGLVEGDRIVSAGVPFLREGQIVEEWRPGQGLDNG
jgi:RND family efflux transporter MFP subunit